MDSRHPARPSCLLRAAQLSVLACGVAASACSVDDRAVSVESGGTGGSTGSSGSGGSGTGFDAGDGTPPSGPERDAASTPEPDAASTPECTSSPDCCGGCPGNQVCTDSTCQCPGGTTQCGVECVNLAANANHCGACDHSCGAGGSCLNRQCQPVALATAQEGALRILLDGSRVYWNLASTTGAILRSIDKAGGNVTDLVCSAGQTGTAPCLDGRGQAAGMALFEGKLMFSVDQALFSVNTDGTGLAAQDPSAFAGFVDDVSVGDGTYAWTTRDATNLNLFSESEGFVGYGSITEGDTVSVLPLGGCVYVANSVGTGIRAACGVGMSAITIYGSNNVIRQLISDGTNMYAAEEHVGVLRLTPATAGLPALDSSTLATVGGAVGALALDESFVYYYEGNGSFGTALIPFCPAQGRIRRVPKAGGPASTLLDSLTICPAALAVDDTSLYWTDLSSAQILKLPKQ